MKFHNTKKTGFTVLELLVAMSITAGIVVLLTSVTRVALDTYKQASDEMRSSRMSQAALGELTRDLNSIVIRPNSPDVWLSVNAKNVSTGSSANPNAVEMCFFSAVTDRYDGNIGSNDLGDISAIRYTLSFNDIVNEALGSSSESRVLNFYRQRIDPVYAYQDIIQKFGDPANISRKDQPDFLPTLFSQARKNDTEFAGGADSSIENFLAENVYEFTVTFEVEDADNPQEVPKFIIVSPSEEFSGHFLVKGNGIISPNSAIASQTSTLWRLRSINIGITVISDQGMDLIANGANISPEELTRQYGNSYSTRVELPDTF